MGISETIIGKIMEKIDVNQEDIDKATEILDMISFTKQDGKDVILINIGENVEIKIYKWSRPRFNYRFIAGFLYLHTWQTACPTLQ